ncbi:MAG: hypothetical protein V4677_14335 [Bacteroidota bacterium]
MNPTFTEIQKFNKWWHYVIAGLPVIITSTMFILVWLNVLKPEDDHSRSYGFITLLTVTSFTLISFMWFISLKLKTTIDQEGIHVRFYGFPFCNKKISWEDIKIISVIKYSPLSDYGGWGVRRSISGKGWCYNVSGEQGIKLMRANGKPFLIGTQQSDEAEKIINFYLKK